MKYTTLCFKKLVHVCFNEKNGQCRYKYLVLGRDNSYVSKNKAKRKKHPVSNKKFSEANIIKMSEFLLLATHLLCLVTCFSTKNWYSYRHKLCSFLSPTCSFIRMKHTSCRRYLGEANRSQPSTLLLCSSVKMMSRFKLNISTFFHYAIPFFYT